MFRFPKTYTYICAVFYFGKIVDFVVSNLIVYSHEMSKQQTRSLYMCNSDAKKNACCNIACVIIEIPSFQMPHTTISLDMVIPNTGKRSMDNVNVFAYANNLSWIIVKFSTTTHTWNRLLQKKNRILRTQTYIFVCTHSLRHTFTSNCLRCFIRSHIYPISTHQIAKKWRVRKHERCNRLVLFVL